VLLAANALTFFDRAIGCRAAFYVADIPGLLGAASVLAVREPERGAAGCAVMYVYYSASRTMTRDVERLQRGRHESAARPATV